jgi:hypothetical protein
MTFLILAATGAYAAPCATEDFESKVTGVSQCLLIRRYGAIEPTSLLVWLHGDVSSGGPANYHFEIAQKDAEHLSPRNVSYVRAIPTEAALHRQ